VSLVAFAAPAQAADVISTWNGSTATWTSANWSSPLFPNNGNGGFTYDAVINGGTVTLTLDQNIIIQAMGLNGGTLTGDGNLTLQANSTWTAGTMSGAGHTKASLLIELLGYVVLGFPFMFFALDNAFRAIDVHTLTEASQSLGAGWTRTLWKVILPNILTGALAGAFLTFALVMGEFTMASLALFNTFPTYINYIGQTKANPAAALTIISFGITWLALLGILLVGRRPGRAAVQVGGAR